MTILTLGERTRVKPNKTRGRWRTSERKRWNFRCFKLKLDSLKSARESLRAQKSFKTNESEILNSRQLTFSLDLGFALDCEHTVGNTVTDGLG